MARNENPSNYSYHKEKMALGMMQAGKDDGVQLDAWTVGELAYAEIGAEGTGSLSGYDRIALGGIPDEYRRNSRGKPSGDIQAGDPDGDGTVEDVKAGAQVRLRLTDYSHTDTIAETEWYDVEDIEAAEPEKRPVMQFDGIDESNWAKEGRHVVVEYRNTDTQSQASFADSSFKSPFIGARESV
jgi:hypothetical protein